MGVDLTEKNEQNDLMKPLADLQKTSLRDQLKTIMEALIACAPGVGGALSVLIEKYIPERKQQRLISFLSDLAAEIGKLNESKVDLAYLESEEFGYLLEQTLDYVSKTYQREKIAAFKNILLHGMTDTETKQDVKEIYLHIADELTEYDIHVLKRMREGYIVGSQQLLGTHRALHEDKSELRNAVFQMCQADETWAQSTDPDWRLNVYNVVLHLVSKKLIMESDPVYEHFKKYPMGEGKKDRYAYNINEFLTSLGDGLVEYILDLEAS